MLGMLQRLDTENIVECVRDFHPIKKHPDRDVCDSEMVIVERRLECTGRDAADEKSQQRSVGVHRGTRGRL